jgi:hypothetical protein
MPDPFAKENQFEAVPFARRSVHIARVIPPFRAKIFVFKMIPRKMVVVTKQRLTILEATSLQREKTEQKCKQPERPRDPAHPDTMRFRSTKRS